MVVENRFDDAFEGLDKRVKVKTEGTTLLSVDTFCLDL